MADHEDDFAPTQTAGYRVGDKKTVDELQNLDAHDESLNKWKASLGLHNAGAATSSDPRKVIITTFGLEVKGRPDIVIDASDPAKLAALKDKTFILKEGAEYRMKVQFRIQHEVVSGLKYLQIVKRSGIRVDKVEEMIGSYGPSPEQYEKKFIAEECPSGMLARGKYDAKSKFIDDDGVTHAEWSWTFQIKKDWE